MFESSKTRRLRDADFHEKYFSGSVLDIGCGEDLVVAHAQPFDLSNGDAQRITEFLPAKIQYDCVHSSHCLEHMKDVRAALAQWWSLVKPNGHLIIVVPDEDLYEQGIWPSIFNSDHKASFRLGKQLTWSPVSYDLKAIIEELPGAEIVDICVQDKGYSHELKLRRMTPLGRLFVLFRRARKVGFRKGMGRQTSSKFDRWVGELEYALEKIEYRFGAPMDQTLKDALAQIQAVVRKRF